MVPRPPLLSTNTGLKHRKEKRCSRVRSQNYLLRGKKKARTKPGLS